MPAHGTAMAQLNIRMASGLKAAGDATLAKADVTPTQLVRAVWSKLAQGMEAFDQLAATLANDTAAKQTNAEEVDESTDPLVANIQRRQALFEQTWGLDPATYVPLSEDQMQELLYDEAVERERERTLHDAQ